MGFKEGMESNVEKGKNFTTQISQSFRLKDLENNMEALIRLTSFVSTQQIW